MTQEVLPPPSSACPPAFQAFGLKIKTTKYANKVPPLSKQDYEALKESLKRRGFLAKYPIVINANGDVLDGHHRLKLCIELGIEPVFAIQDFAGDEIEEELFVRQINRARRQLPLWQKIEMALEEKPLLAKQAERNMKAGKTLSPDKERVHTDKKLASELGIGTGTLWMVEQVVKAAKESPEEKLEYDYDARYRGHEGPTYAQLLSDARIGRLTPVEAYNVLKRDQRIKAKRAEVAEAATARGLPKTLLLNADSTKFEETLPEIKDNSVDLIVTDPPYMQEYLHDVFEALARFAAKKLKPGGSLLFYYNVYFEPKIHQMFAKYEEKEQLTWWWRFHVDHEGSNNNAIVHERRVKVKGKPMMWFVKGKRRLTDSFVSDAIHSTKPDKDKHPWAQSQVEAEYLVKMLTISEDSLVVDPFLGSGAFAIPAIKLGRYFIGIELDKETLDRARSYIAQETASGA